MTFQKWYQAVATGKAIVLDEAPEHLADIPQGYTLVVLDERDQDLGIPENVTSQERLNELKKHVELRPNNSPYVHTTTSIGFPGRIVWSLVPSK